MLPNEETLVAARDPYAGKVFDKYKLVERLGAGGMGLVYRAEQARMDRHVAIKLLPFTLVNDEVNVKRIEREAKAMGNLRHPNIATIFDFGFSEDYQPYLVMELITGRSLGNLLKEHHVLDPHQVIKIMVQVADAMDYAHKHGIIHRDLKPDNIMLDSHHTENFVKVLDFGIAKSVDAAVNLSQSLTRPGTVVGSPLYMSPEQCVGQKLDPTSDIYSLGVIMYEALTGIIPCKGATIYETIGKKTTEAPPPFPPQFAELKELEALTLACLATMKTERPESMLEVRERLRAMCSTTIDMPSSITISTTATVEPVVAEPLPLSAPLDEAQTTDELLAHTAPIKLVEEVTVVDVTKLAAPARSSPVTDFVNKISSSQKLIAMFLACAIISVGGIAAVFHQGSTSTGAPRGAKVETACPNASGLNQTGAAQVVPKNASGSTQVMPAAGSTAVSPVAAASESSAVSPVAAASASSASLVEVRPAAVGKSNAAPIGAVKGAPANAPPRKAKSAPKKAAPRTKTWRTQSSRRLPPGQAKKAGRFSKMPRPLSRLFKHLREGRF
jgi:serine/threonine-protein kinase